MSTNVYRSQQRIDFSATQPATYYGWYITGTSASMSVHPFQTLDQQEALVSLVEHTLNDRSIPRGTVDDAAAYLAFATWGDHEDDREWGRKLIELDFPEHADALSEFEDELQDIGLHDLVQAAKDIPPLEGARPRAAGEIPPPRLLAEAVSRADTRKR